MKFYHNDSECKSGCCCNEEHDEILTLTIELEDGSSEECEILKVLEINGKSYVALLPLEKEEYMVFGCVEHGEEVEIINIENEEEYENVVNAFEDYFDSDEFYGDMDLEDDEDEEE